MIIKLRFTHGGEPGGREYSYYAPDGMQTGDLVDIDGRKHGVVTAVDVPAEEIESFRDKVKTVNGKYTKEEN